jgi:hypothetical protein
MIVTLFDSTRDRRPRRAGGVSFDLLSAVLPPHVSYLRKELAPAFSAAEWAPGDERGAQPLRVHALVLDLEAVGRAAVADLLSRVGDRAVLCYSTWSHSNHEGPDAPWFLRVVLPLARAVPAAEWPDAFDRLSARLCPGLADCRAGRDPRRVYFLPSARPGSSRRFYLHATGRALDPGPAARLGVVP